MKAFKTLKIFAVSVIGTCILLPLGAFAQDEYDDMYFNPKDRKEVKKESVYAANSGVTKKETSKDVITPSSSTELYGNAQENYSSKNVNPEYIERYKSTSKDSATVESLTEDDSYFVENYDRSKFERENNNQSFSNYGYAGSYNGFSNGFYDPYYSRYGYYGRSFYDPFYGSGWGFMPGLSLSLSFGTGWGYSPWYSPYGGFGGYYSPWYSRYYYNPWAYDPWYGGYGPYSRYGYGYYPGYYSNNYYYYANGGRESISPYNRRVSRGADNYVVNENAVPNRRTATVNQQKVTGNEEISSRARVERDYSKSQNEYYTRSQSRYQNTVRTNNIQNEVRSTRNTIGTTSTPRVRSTRNSIEYSRPSYRETQSRIRTNTYNNSSINRSSWSNGNRSYQRSRSGSSYSSPSRSSSSYSSGSYNSGSRSSGYSAPSRSSGSSSGSGSRSSGRR